MARWFVGVLAGAGAAFAGVGLVWHYRTGMPDVAQQILAGFDPSTLPGGVTISYPLDQTIFPPDLAPPTFRWAYAGSEADQWVVMIDFADGGEPARAVCDQQTWMPPAAEWDSIKRRSRERTARVTILGVRRGAAGAVLCSGGISFKTSQYEVGAPLFYREVNLPFIEAVKDPSMIRWRHGPVSSLQPPPVVLEGLPVCGNCHSFSADGTTFGMDVDYANDKGSYVLAAVQEDIVLSQDNIITWSDYRRDDGQLTFGLLSQISPNGRYVVSTVKDRSVFVPTPDLAFSQLFFPIRGILAVYDRQTGQYWALPGADDPEYVQSNPSWSPDGQYIVFARSRAYHLKMDHGEVLLTAEECAEFLDGSQTFLFDLYRVPFNEGRGGTAEPVAGASHNGLSNYFAKYSPDGRWIVFCRARSFMLLQPDSELYIMPAEGGAARRLSCNTGRMNSWHSWSPNGKWLVFSSKQNSPYTQLLLTHIDDNGESSPPVVLEHLTNPDRAANIPEFVNAGSTAIAQIHERFLDDFSYVRAGDAFIAARDDAEGAIGRYRQAIALNPENAVAHSNLGGLLVTQGKFGEGVPHLQEALRLDPRNGSAHYNLGMFRFRQRDIDAAIVHLTKAVEYKPDLSAAHRILGALLCSRGRVTEGIRRLTEAVERDPADAAAHYCLGDAFATQGMIPPALIHLARAAELMPKDADAHHRLGQLLYAERQFGEALTHMSRCVELRPTDVRMLCDLAAALATATPPLRDAARAVDLADQACRLTDRQAAEPLAVLGLALAAAGRLEEAIWASEQALVLVTAAGQEPVAAQLRQRIERYRLGEADEPAP